MKKIKMVEFLEDYAWSNQWEPSTKIQSNVYIKTFGENNHSNQDIAKIKSKDIPKCEMPRLFSRKDIK